MIASPSKELTIGYDPRSEQYIIQFTITFHMVHGQESISDMPGWDTLEDEANEAIAHLMGNRFFEAIDIDTIYNLGAPQNKNSWGCVVWSERRWYEECELKPWPGFSRMVSTLCLMDKSKDGAYWSTLCL